MIRVAISTSISRTWIEERGYQVGRYIIIKNGEENLSARKKAKAVEFRGLKVGDWLVGSRFRDNLLPDTTESRVENVWPG